MNDSVILFFVITQQMVSVALFVKILIADKRLRDLAERIERLEKLDMTILAFLIGLAVGAAFGVVVAGIINIGTGDGR